MSEFGDFEHHPNKYLLEIISSIFGYIWVMFNSDICQPNCLISVNMTIVNGVYRVMREILIYSRYIYGF